MISIIPWSGGALPVRWAQRQLQRREEIDAVVRDILGGVRARGDAALLEFIQKHDGAALTQETLFVTHEEIDEAYRRVPADVQAALRGAAANIQAYHKRQIRSDWIEEKDGKTLGRLVRPLDSVGLYAPGGTAAYPSSVLMNAIPARVAGVRRVLMATPPQRDGSVYPPTLVAADIAGVTLILRAGGAYAIAAMAYGTQSVPKVDRIVGPGNAYVAAAKRMVFGDAGIDMIAGPSEVLIIADETARADWVAADMLSQAEHDEMAAAVLVTPSEPLARAVEAELQRQAAALPRFDIAKISLRDSGMILVVDNLDTAMEAANSFAPEHLELAVADPAALLSKVRHAGCVFLGHHAPEPLGDYWAGTNHVLPTAGTARFSSPLSVDDFVKTTGVVGYTPTALRAAAPSIAVLARAEGLEAHARSAEIRQIGAPDGEREAIR